MSKDIDCLNNDYKKFLDGCKNQSFNIIKGDVAIIFSAPHNVKQLRYGRLKFSEPHTGRLAYDLAKTTNAYAIIKTAYREDDANFDIDCAYKDELSQYIKANKIKLLIDLHQMSSMRCENFDIGIAGGDGLLGRIDLFDCLNKTLKRTFSFVAIDKNFPARHAGTVSKYISTHCKIPCIQLEINSKLLNQNEYHKVFLLLVEATTEMDGIL